MVKTTEKRPRRKERSQCTNDNLLEEGVFAVKEVRRISSYQIATKSYSAYA